MSAPRGSSFAPSVMSHPRQCMMAKSADPTFPGVRACSPAGARLPVFRASPMAWFRIDRNALRARLLRSQLCRQTVNIRHSPLLNDLTVRQAEHGHLPDPHLPAGRCDALKFAELSALGRESDRNFVPAATMSSTFSCQSGNDRRWLATSSMIPWIPLHSGPTTKFARAFDGSRKQRRRGC